MPCQRLVRIVVRRGHGDPVQRAQSVICSHLQAALGTVPVPGRETPEENAGQSVRSRIARSLALSLGWFSHPAETAQQGSRQVQQRWQGMDTPSGGTAT